MTDNERELVRQLSFDCDGPVDIDIELGTGSIEVQLADDTDPTQDASSPAQDTGPTGVGQQAIIVEVRHEPRSGGSNWGLAGLLNWVGGQLGSIAPDLAEHAVRETVITMEDNQLNVYGPRAIPLRAVPLTITVHAPAGSSVGIRSSSADVRLGGWAGQVAIDTGSGDVSMDCAAGPVHVKAGSGTMRLGTMLDGLSARSGSGDFEVTSLSGGGSLVTGSGDIWVGTLAGPGGRVTLRTGSGDLAIADAAAGLVELVTGTGDVRVGIRPGVLAEVDVVSGSGHVDSDLPMSPEPPAGGEATLRVRGRTGTGDAVIGSARA